MGEKSYRLSANVCALPAADADKLISAGDGDSALLYIYLLRRGEAPDAELAAALGMDERRISAAAERLRGMGLLSAAAAPRIPPAQELPEYTSEEVVRRSDEDPAFRGVLAEAERLLGHTLSGADTRTLFGIYDYLGLPVDVIMELMHHCADEARLKYGPGRVPRMRDIEREAYVWANREIMTFEQAEEYIRSRARLHDAAEGVKRALGIGGRPLAPSERKYIESWLDLGYGPEALALAYDRTVTNIGQLKWSYMNKIVLSWHDKGLHSPEEIEKGDAPRRTASKPKTSRPANSGAGDLERMKKIYDKVRRG